MYGSYFFVIGAIFLAMAVYSMTRIGWRTCWRLRYLPFVPENGSNESSETSDVDLSQLDNDIQHSLNTVHDLDPILTSEKVNWCQHFFTLSLPDRPKPATFVILHCLAPDDFTLQGRASLVGKG